MHKEQDNVLLVTDAGLLDYNEGLQLQEQVLHARMQQKIPDILLLLEHKPVITLGRRAKQENLLMPVDKYHELGIDVINVNRGGDVTFHGPGQLVGYLIAHVPSLAGTVSDLVKKLGEGIKQGVTELGVQNAVFREDLPGVWVPNPWRKFAAIGLHIHKAYTTHGFALNVNNDLHYFDLIIPCGIKQYGVTSLQQLGIQQKFEDVKSIISSQIANGFKRNVTNLSFIKLKALL